MKNGNVTYGAYLANDSCIFDTQIGFDTPEEALEWASDRGGNYNIIIGIDGSIDPGVNVIASCRNGVTRFQYYNGREYPYVSAEQVCTMVRGL